MYIPYTVSAVFDWESHTDVITGIVENGCPDFKFSEGFIVRTSSFDKRLRTCV